MNNAKFLSFIEDARLRYLLELGLFDGKNFDDSYLIVGDIHCRYIQPIEPDTKVIVSLGVTQ